MNEESDWDGYGPTEVYGKFTDALNKTSWDGVCMCVWMQKTQ